LNARTAIRLRRAESVIDPVEALPEEAQRIRAACAEASAVREAVYRTRKATGFTKAELAERAGVSREDVCFVEEGGLDPGAWVLGKIAQALGVGLVIW
jgi:DNA-binding XRE family transcriptional regulator